MKKIIIALLVAGMASLVGYALLSGEHSLSVGIQPGRSVAGLNLDEPHIGWLKILNSCFFEGKGGCYWYYAALSARRQNRNPADRTLNGYPRRLINLKLK